MSKALKDEIMKQLLIFIGMGIIITLVMIICSSAAFLLLHDFIKFI